MSLMSKVTVQRSTCYDFLSSLMRIENNEGFTPSKNPNQEIRDWADWALTQFPADIRELLSKFFSLETAYAMTLGGYIARWNVSDTANFLKRLEDVPAQDILLRFLYYGIGPGKNISLEDISRIMADDKEAVRFINEQLSFPPQEKWQTLQFLMDPEGMKQDLLRLLRWHYDHLYSKVGPQVDSCLRKPEQDVIDKFRKYGDEYLKLMMPVNYSNLKDAKITVAISYYWETGQYINILDDVYLCGYRFFDSLESKHAILAGTQVFKTLADETRLNIIRLLVNRPWYGHEIAQRLSISNSTVSHHMSLLAMHGMVRISREENRIYFELLPEEFKRIISTTVENILEEA